MSDELTRKFREVLRTPNLAIELDRNVFGGQAMLRLSLPGPTPRSKRREPLPVIVGEQGESHADMLRRLANAIEQVNTTEATQ